ncbi:MAG: LuxR C-terminal-related transcriptional regulator [Caldilineaceae bacterium]
MLLTTKLFIPTAGDPLVPRPRLLAKLDAGLARRLILVSAMAGYGKTTLLADWLHQRALAAAWLSLDDYDNDPARFLRYLVTAYQQLDDHIGGAVIAQLQTPQPPAWDMLVTQLLNDLAECRLSTVLVLDDYHVIEHEAIHAVLTLLIENLPPQHHVVMTARSDPPLPLARWRVRRHLAEIRAADLRFSQDETAHFLGHAWSGDVSTDALAVIAQRMEGWAAGLQLAALSLADGGDLTTTLSSFSGDHAHVMDYLIEEVLEQQSAHVQRFLLYTSILDRFCAPLCDALLAADGAEDAPTSAAALLDHLARHNLFIYALDEAQRWRRFHQLFADALRARLQQTHAAQVPALHARAGRWFAAQGLVNEAIPHLLAAGDTETAGQLIEGESETLLRQGQHTTLQSWLDQLPDDLVRSTPGLALAQARTLLVINQLDAAEDFLAAAGGQAAGDPSHGPVAAVAAGIALNRGHYARTVELALAALAQLPADSPLRPETLLHLGLAQSNSGAPDAAERSYADAVTAGRRLGDQRTAVVALFNQGALLHSRGALRKAAAQYEEVIRYARSVGVAKMPQTAYAQLMLGDLWTEWNDVEKATQLVTEAADRLAQGGLMRMLTVAHVYQARLAWAQGQLDAAQRALAAAFEVVDQHTLPLRYAGPVWALQARLWLVTGNLPAAAGWAARCGLSPDDATFALVHEEMYVALAHVLHAQGRSADAAQLIGRYRAQMMQEGRGNSVIVLAPLHAVLVDATGDRDRALKTLKSVLPDAAEEGYIRSFVEVGAPLTPLLTILSRTRQSPAVATLLRRLLDQLASTAPALIPAPPSPSGPAPSPLVESLSERELEVLRLVAAGLSDRQVAEKLVLAVGTVKKHLNNIYGKLGVGNRTSALARARVLRLIE